jgi:16S rRNA (cytidine1402-2'-O)-methyltransferase
MGTLYLVSTPIGNLEDISQRALRILGEVNLVAAEDTRHTRRLLDHYQLSPSLVSYHEHNKAPRLDQLLRALDEGDVAVVSDAGAPNLSDPGYELVRAAWEAGHRVSPIPGPSAPVAALTASGLPSDRFLYLGYFPRRRAERLELIESVSRLPWTLVAFETPHRLKDSLGDLAAVLGEERLAAVGRELTKLHEEFVRGSLAEIRKHFDDIEPIGEITVIIHGAEAEPPWTDQAVREALMAALEQGQSASQAAKQVARLSGRPRQEIYRMALEAK